MTRQDPPFVLLTVTWSRDKAHFSLLRESLLGSAFAQFPHHVVVQHEDMESFHEFPGITLHSTADILPPEVESRRREAIAWQTRLGRRATVVGGSLARVLGWPNWVRYTGWHTQQLSKLAFVGQSPVETVVVLDSDVIVTPAAEVADFISPGKMVCYERWQPLTSISSKVHHWQATAHRLFALEFPAGDQFDAYYDTPFVMHATVVRELFAWLTRQHGRNWWQVLLSQPPRRWSEFGIYKQYLRAQAHPSVEWRSADHMAYLFDVSDIGRLVERFGELFRQSDCHYVTIHSQSSGRQLWTAENYRHAISSLLQTARL